jgi:prevent-host-death family protein
MAAIPEIVPVTDLRQDAAAVLKRVQSSAEPLVITQRGRAAAVMLSIDAYERAERERDLLRLLVRGEQRNRSGRRLRPRRRIASRHDAGGRDGMRLATQMVEFWPARLYPA